MDDVNQILSSKPFNVDNDYLDILYKKLNSRLATSTSSKTLKIVQIADPHLDLWYEVGSIADCGGSYCCRNNAYKGQGSKIAGKFGSTDGPCDPPQITFQQTLEYIRDYIQPDVIIWTGDNSPHDDYSTSQTAVTTTLNVTSQMIQAVFPDKLRQTFPSYGNHDAYPNN